jgi:biopolymer transport protein ExbB
MLNSLYFLIQEAVTNGAAAVAQEAPSTEWWITSWFRSIQHAFFAGGKFMYPILLLSVVAVVLIIERAYVLYYKANVNKADFLQNLQKLIFQGNLNNAVIYASGRSAPLTNIIKAGLVAAQKGNDTDVQVAIDEVSLKELPTIEKRTGYLAMIGNVATLMGLLGTISGLITSFAGVANADPAEKASKLAFGISEALNCTAFGLIIAIPALLCYAVLQGKSQTLLDDINEASVSVLNFITLNRAKFGKSSNPDKGE